jgi:hypothetical protein
LAGIRDIQRAVVESTILQSLVHSYIVSLHYAFADVDCMHLALSYAGGGNLASRIEASNGFCERVARLIFAELVSVSHAPHSTALEVVGWCCVLCLVRRRCC